MATPTEAGRPELVPPAAPGFSPACTKEVTRRMRRVVTGEELAQLQNPNPFAMPRWRAPVYRTPVGIILAAKFVRLLAWIIRMIVRHPLAASVLALAAVTWLDLGWATLGALVLAAVLILVCWRWCWPVSFSRRVAARPAASGAPGATGAGGPRS